MNTKTKNKFEGKMFHTDKSVTLYVSEWISVEKEFPEEDEVVLVFCPEWCAEGYDLATYNRSDSTWENSSNQELTEFVTHWMLLPEPPK